MENVIEKYKGYTICKPIRDTYMKVLNYFYLAYDENECYFDGAKTLNEIKRRIDIES